MSRNISGRTVAIILLLLLGGIQFFYWRTLVYQPRIRGGPGGPGPSGGPAGPAVLAKGRPDLWVTTVAGEGLPGYRDGRAGRAMFDGPAGVVLDRSGNLFIADTRNHRIRRMARDGVVTTTAGSGPAGDLAGGFADGPASRCRFRCPAAVAVGADGTLYVADTGNHCIRRITGQTVSTLAGRPTPGEVDGVGSAARFRQPAGLALDAAGNLYVADTGNAAIRKVERSGKVTTLAHGGPLKAPTGLALASGDTLLAGDPGARQVFRISTSGGAIAPASFRLTDSDQLETSDAAAVPSPAEPAGTGAASNGVVVVADIGRHVIFARQGSDVSLLAGTILAGTIQRGSSDSTGDKSSFNYPFGVAVDPNGAVFVADYGNNCIRHIGPKKD